MESRKRDMDRIDRRPITRAVISALNKAHDPRARADLLFLEEFQQGRTGTVGASLRAIQIRRANPGLAAAIDRELKDAL
jgi:hypothetical protein